MLNLPSTDATKILVDAYHDAISHFNSAVVEDARQDAKLAAMQAFWPPDKGIQGLASVK